MVSNVILDLLKENADELKIDSSNFFAQNIPQQYVDVENTVVLVSEIHDIFTNRASDISTAKDQMIEIQIFYRGDTDDEYTQNKINQILEKQYFYQIDSYPDTDPVTGFFNRTMKYEHTEEI